MAQYIEVSGVSFGNGHSDNPTYAFTVGTGDIFLSGSGGYVNSPTGITKATLTSGIKLYLSDDNATAVTASVESGFTCVGTTAYASWVIPSPTPTPTPTTTPVISSVLIELLAAAQELGTWPEYTVQIAMVGYKTLTRIVQQTSASQLNDNFDMILTGTPDGTGTITVSRTAPDATVTDATAITIGQSDGFTTTPTVRTYTIGQAITNVSFDVSGFDHGENMTINISEG
jgi:hypothetical protein